MLHRSMLAACAMASLTAIAWAQTGSSPPQTQQRSAPGATQTQPGQPQPSQAQPGTTQGQASTTQPRSGQTQAGLQEIQALQLTFYAVQPADVLFSNLMGVDVHNAQNESIGEIEDAVIDNGKTLRALIIGVGGFLGLGERYVSVEPKSVLLARDAGGNLRAYVNTTRETLRNAPEFKYEGPFRRRQAAGQPGSTQPGTSGTGGTTMGSGSQPSNQPAQPQQQKQ